ncbi:MAG: tRNA dimethylallyltransferase [Candidatus Collierbacteria bacterium GW2011_GWB1_45_35]|nr:MAG: tRNA dimethylallyltransferase [Candidatus Collierbacteria bacterium GW2011_GWB1_45_35]
MPKKPAILVICGATATGKTSLALKVATEIISLSSLRGAKRRGSPGYPLRVNLTPSTSVNILSADSRQIYRGLDIVTGKDLPRDLPPMIRFFGLDLVEPNQPFSLLDYVRYAKKVIQESLDKDIPLIIVGGTGLYLKAITSDLLNVQVPPNQSLRLELEKLTLVELQNQLQEVNFEKYKSLNNSDIHNPRRLIRAIEISSANPSLRGGIPTWQSHSTPTFLWVGLRQDKEAQSASIRQRVLKRLNAGAIDEVKQLIKKYPERDMALFTSLGVREIIEFLNKKISREELINLWTATENDYVRRQMVWFKKQPGIIWYDRNKINKDLAIKLAELFKSPLVVSFGSYFLWRQSMS